MCPAEFKPGFCKWFVDDIFVLFEKEEYNESAEAT